MRAPDTIVAISTPTGYARRAVVRLSGPLAVPLAAERFTPCSDAGPDWRRTFHVTAGRLRFSGPGLATPALLYVMRAPQSYTREDVVELHLPGSPALLDMVLDGLLEGAGPGLRLARPGEFTRRAFVNGRIDLARAEAVLAVIRARSESELLMAAARLRGRAGRRCAELQERITALRVGIEAGLDFAEHGIELVSTEELLADCESVRRELCAEAAAGRGAIASDGALDVVICGPPNAGKSSIMNRLAGGPAAIVHGRPGTTRDAVTARVELAGMHFRLTDTAGLMADATGPDAEAVERAGRLVGSCRLVLLVLDGSRALPTAAVRLARMGDARRVICAVNKRDLPPRLNRERLARELPLVPVVHTSALTGEGIDDLRAALAGAVAEGRLDASSADGLFNARQRDALRRAADELAEAEGALRRGMGHEFAALNLRQAADVLGEVTGEVTPQDVLDRIFAMFCIGK